MHAARRDVEIDNFKRAARIVAHPFPKRVFLVRDNPKRLVFIKKPDRRDARSVLACRSEVREERTLEDFEQESLVRMAVAGIDDLHVPRRKPQLARAPSSRVSRARCAVLWPTASGHRIAIAARRRRRAIAYGRPTPFGRRHSTARCNSQNPSKQSSRRRSPL